MTPLRVAVIADYLEEKWPSMDLVADMLVAHLAGERAPEIQAALIRPSMPRRARRFAVKGMKDVTFTVDRMTARFWDYPRVVAADAPRFDVFHVVDHSYAHLVHRLPAERTLVTCHDIDAFRSVFEPDVERRSPMFRAMTRHILNGLRRAGHVTCDTAATRDAIVSKGDVDPAKTSVVHNGPHQSCTPEPEPAADVEASRMLGPKGRFTELLHVGSTIDRKRIDVLLEVFARIRRAIPSVRLVRVGGHFSAEQRRLCRELDLEEAVVVLPFLDRSTLAAVYRRAAVVLMPSDREGFGLPVLEALACGTAVVASDIPPLREVGGQAVMYCAPGDVDSWVATIGSLLAEQRSHADRWRQRSETGIARAASFSWSRYTTEMVALYRQLAGSGAAAAV
jgi:glycosyltransferase involved in cell wall biosynthesis